MPSTSSTVPSAAVVSDSPVNVIGKSQVVAAADEVRTMDSFTPSAVGCSTRLVSGRIPSYSAVDPVTDAGTSSAPASDQETDSEEETVSVASAPVEEPPETTESACTARPKLHGNADGPAEGVKNEASWAVEGAGVGTGDAAAAPVDVDANETFSELAFSCHRPSPARSRPVSNGCQEPSLAW